MPKLTSNSKRSVVTTHSAVSIVNAIGTGFGGTIGIDIPCKVVATLVNRSEGRNLIVSNSILDNHKLIPECVSYVERFLRRKIPEEKMLCIEIRSEIPLAVGLKSSSAISLAVVSAVSKLLCARGNEAIGSKDLLELSCRASKSSGASITGAFDDAVACLLGGIALTNNTHFRVIKHTNIPEELGSIVMIRIPARTKAYTSSIDRRAYSNFTKHLLTSFSLAKRGNIKGAMMLNSLVQCAILGYSFQPINSAIFEGATCAGVSGKGPAIAALCQTIKSANRIERRWNEEQGNIEIIRIAVIQPKEFLHS